MSEQWQPTFGTNDFSIEREETLYDGFFKMRKLYLRHKTFAGGEISIQRELFWRDEAVCVLLYDAPRQRVVLVEQFRVGVYDSPEGPWMLELVAGIMEPGESSEEVARREAVEEAGAELGEVLHITRFAPSTGEPGSISTCSVPASILRVLREFMVSRKRVKISKCIRWQLRMPINWYNRVKLIMPLPSLLCSGCN